MKALLVCGGGISDYEAIAGYTRGIDYVVCADGGARHLSSLRTTPDILIGDFDSIDEKDFELLKQKKVDILQFPAEKDMTDSELALEHIIQKGFEEVVIIGATGSRLDHTFANVFLLKKLLDRGINGIIADPKNEFRLIDRTISLNRRKGFKISLLPVSGEVKGVTTEGLHYMLKDATLAFGTTWGISNEFTAETAIVSISSGLLLVILSSD